MLKMSFSRVIHSLKGKGQAIFFFKNVVFTVECGISDCFWWIWMVFKDFDPVIYLKNA